jgi:hypothetical protein
MSLKLPVPVPPAPRKRLPPKVAGRHRAPRRALPPRRHNPK